MSYNSPPAYGAYNSLVVSSDDCEMNADGPILTYLSEYGETFVLIVPSETIEAGGATITFQSTCTVAECLGSQYLAEDGICESCPEGMVSFVGATSIDNCTSCKDGYVPSHPKSGKCALAIPDPSISTALSWRVWTSSQYAETWYRWVIPRMKFYESEGCEPETEVDTTVGIPLDVRTEPSYWGPDKAFQDALEFHSGRDEDKNFWLGMEFPQPNVTVRCIFLNQKVNNGVSQLYVQAKQTSDSPWENVWLQKDLVTGDNLIKIEDDGQSRDLDSPSQSPSQSYDEPRQKDCEGFWKRCESSQDCCSDVCRRGRCRLSVGLI